MPTPTTPSSPVDAAPADAPRPRLVARLLSRTRRGHLEQAIAAGRLREVERFDLLAVEGLRTLARKSLWLLVAGGGGVVRPNLVVRCPPPGGPLLRQCPPPPPAPGPLLANAPPPIFLLPARHPPHA